MEIDGEELAGGRRASLWTKGRVASYRRRNGCVVVSNLVVCRRDKVDRSKDRRDCTSYK